MGIFSYPLLTNFLVIKQVNQCQSMLLANLKSLNSFFHHWKDYELGCKTCIGQIKGRHLIQNIDGVHRGFEPWSALASKFLASFAVTSFTMPASRSSSEPPRRQSPGLPW